jgi:hypothetical protein
VGADRRGPLAAFVVIAIIAAVLLVTSVRSQAAPGWLRPGRIPASVVAAPVTEPHLWGTVTGSVHEVVRDGAVLVRRAATTGPQRDTTTTEALDASAVVAAPGSVAPGSVAPGSVARHLVAGTSTHHPTTHPHHAAPAPHHSTPADSEDGSAPDTHDHGRHLGWDHGHWNAGDEHGHSGDDHGHDQQWNG